MVLFIVYVVLFLGGGYFFGVGSSFRLPRLTETDLDFFLMPLLGYCAIVVVAQGIAYLERRLLRASE